LTDQYPNVMFAGTLSLVPTDEGGRKRAIRSGYRCQFRLDLADYPGDWDAMLLFVNEVAPGSSSRAVIFTSGLHNEVWGSVQLPASIGLYEGPRRVGQFDAVVRYAPVVDA